MNVEKLNRLIDTMDKRGIPGCDLAVVRENEMIYRRMSGFSDHAQTRPVGDRDLYWIFSASKVITCTTCMRLVEDGKINLDAPLSRYLPEFSDMRILCRDGSTVPAQNQIKIRHLFAMTAGLTYDLKTPSLLRVRADKNASTREVVAAMAESPLVFEPGTRYRYSLCHDVLAAVAEVVTDIRFSDYQKKIMFEPLGMNETVYTIPDEWKSRLTETYRYDNGLATATPVGNDCDYRLTDNYESGGAGICCTVNDYMKMLTTLSNGGISPDGYRLLKPETVAMMQKNELPDEARHDLSNTRLHGYGWGLCGRVHMNPDVSLSLAPVGEFGWDGAAGAFAMVDTVNRIALFFAISVRNCNYAYHVLHPVIRNLIYEN